MHITTDDDLTRIDRTYLGPKGKRIPFVATYRQYAIGLAVAALSFGTLLLIGFPMWNKYLLVLWGFGSIFVTMFVNNRMRADLTLRDTARMAWQEVLVPREPSTIEHHPIRLDIPVYDPETPYVSRRERRKHRAADRAATRGARARKGKKK